MARNLVVAFETWILIGLIWNPPPFHTTKEIWKMRKIWEILLKMMKIWEILLNNLINSFIFAWYESLFSMDITIEILIRKIKERVCEDCLLDGSLEFWWIYGSFEPLWELLCKWLGVKSLSLESRKITFWYRRVEDFMRKRKKMILVILYSSLWYDGLQEPFQVGDD